MACLRRAREINKIHKRIKCSRRNKAMSFLKEQAKQKNKRKKTCNTQWWLSEQQKSPGVAWCFVVGFFSCYYYYKFYVLHPQWVRRLYRVS